MVFKALKGATNECFMNLFQQGWLPTSTYMFYSDLLVLSLCCAKDVKVVHLISSSDESALYTSRHSCHRIFILGLDHGVFERALTSMRGSLRRLHPFLSMRAKFQNDYCEQASLKINDSSSHAIALFEIKRTATARAMLSRLGLDMAFQNFT